MSNQVAGVNLGKIDKDHLYETAGEILARDISKLNVEDLILELQKKFAILASDNIALCDVCGGSSDIQLDSCPYCGEEGQEGTDDDDINDAVPVKVATSVVEAAVAAEEPKVKAVPAERPSKRTMERVKKERAKHLEPKKKTSLALVKHDSKKAVELTLAISEVRHMISEYESAKVEATQIGLDQAVKNVAALRAAAAISYWRIGDYVKKVIFDPSLWAHRTKLNKAGEEVPAYKGFDQFVKEEMGMSVNWAYRLMEVANKFSEQHMVAYGMFTLKVIAGLPADDQRAVLDEIKSAGMKDRSGVWTLPGGKRGIFHHVKKFKESKGIRGQQKSHLAKATAGSVAKRQRFTTILDKERGVILAMKKDKKDQVARKLADRPVFVLEGTQSAIHFSIIENAKGELAIQYVYKRKEA